MQPCQGQTWLIFLLSNALLTWLQNRPAVMPDGCFDYIFLSLYYVMVHHSVQGPLRPFIGLACGKAINYQQHCGGGTPNTIGSQRLPVPGGWSMDLHKNGWWPVKKNREPRWWLWSIRWPTKAAHSCVFDKRPSIWVREGLCARQIGGRNDPGQTDPSCRRDPYFFHLASSCSIFCNNRV